MNESTSRMRKSMTNNRFYRRTGKFFITLWLAVSLLDGVAHSAINSMEEAVNKAGRQRMLTQKLLKEYTLIGMRVSYGDPQQALQKSMALFEAQLGELISYITDKASLESLTAVDPLWTPVKIVLNEAPDINKVAALQRDLETLHKACHKSTLLIAKASGSYPGEIVNTAGRQRMLSQRMAGLYMLKTWGIDDPEFKNKLETAMEQFSAAHKTLSSSPLNTDEIKELLAKAEKSYLFFENMGKSSSGKFIPSLINKSAMEILKNMNTATGLYAPGGNKQ